MTQVGSFEASHKVTGITFSPDGRHLAVRSNGLGDTLELFDAQTGTRIWRHGARGAGIGDVTFSADGQLLATGSSVNKPVVLGADHGRVVLKVDVPAINVFVTAAISPDGTRLATAAGVAVRWYDVSSGAKTLGLRLIAGCNDMQYSPDGTRLATCGKDGIHVWDPAIGQQRAALAPAAEVRSMAFGSCGHVLVTVGKDHVVRVFDIASGSQRRQLDTAPDTTGVTLGPDGRFALASSSDGTLRLWDVMAGYERTRLPAPAKFRHAALSIDGTKLATSNGKSVAIQTVRPAPLTPIGQPAQDGSCVWCGAGAAEPAAQPAAGAKHEAPEETSAGDLSRGGRWAVKHATAITASLAAVVLGSAILGLLTGQARTAASIAAVPLFLLTMLYRTWNAQQGPPTTGRKRMNTALATVTVALMLGVLLWWGGGSG
jgi:hypothetical protein